MSIAILCFALGLVFLFFEVFAPGPIFGILGGISLVTGVAVVGTNHGMVPGVFAGAGAIVAVAVTLYAELVWLPTTRFAKRFTVRSTSGTTSRPGTPSAEEVVGQPAEAVTILAPSGYVMVAGHRYEATSQSGHVKPGQSLRVVGLDNFRLLVTRT